jgi:hypothetical protein
VQVKGQCVPVVRQRLQANGVIGKTFLLSRFFFAKQDASVPGRYLGAEKQGGASFGPYHACGKEKKSSKLLRERFDRCVPHHNLSERALLGGS